MRLVQNQMKPILLALLSAGLLAFSSCARELRIVRDDVPPAVLASFTTKFPTAENPRWEVSSKRGRLVYEADFYLAGVSREAEFLSDGTYVGD